MSRAALFPQVQRRTDDEMGMRLHFRAALAALTLLSACTGQAPDAVGGGTTTSEALVEASEISTTTAADRATAISEALVEASEISSTTAANVTPSSVALVETTIPVRLEASEVLPAALSGRWAPANLEVETREADNSALLTSTPPELSGCEGFLALVSLQADAWTTSSDEGRGHELDHNAVDVGTSVWTEALLAGIDNSIASCARIDEGYAPSAVAGLNIDVDGARALQLRFDTGQSLWLAAAGRENILAWVVVFETGTDPLVDADVADFASVVTNMVTRLEAADGTPLG